MKKSGRMLIILAKISFLIAQSSQIPGFQNGSGAGAALPSERQQRQNNWQR